MSRSVSERVVLVTGAASGMGRAIARVFADEGAKVAVTDRDLNGATRVGSEIREAGGIAADWALDVADPERIDVVVADVVTRLGPVDILVNNAGVSLPAPIGADEFEAAWQTTLAVNLTAHARMVRACLPYLLRNRDGRVVNIASTEALGAQSFISPYTASKHGVVGLTRALAVELGPHGVTVNCVCPGPIHTGMTAWIPDDAKEKYARRRVPLRRYGDPEEVAHMVVNLALPASSFVTGAIIPVDGGLVTMNG
ncbi:MAG: 3-oxoacyl-[acyl-carrier protein] reductase [Actinomycetota bacterium]|nr:3-oxoacyl-[acyl-carrier protein] reductase [Actinomycetota bacterium]